VIILSTECHFAMSEWYSFFFFGVISGVVCMMEDISSFQRFFVSRIERIMGRKAKKNRAGELWRVFAFFLLFLERHGSCRTREFFLLHLSFSELGYCGQSTKVWHNLLDQAC
jgi:hypothetical protein